VNSTYFNVYSDYRIKHDVETLDDTYSVDKLNPVKYKLNCNNENKFGFIAHEVQEIYPNIVTGEKDGVNTQSVDYTQLIPILVKEIKDLKENNKTLLKNQESLEERLMYIVSKHMN